MRPLASLFVCLLCLAPPAASQQSPADTGDVFLANVVQERPQVLSSPQLHYPDLMRQAGIEGRVVVEFIVDTLGRAEPASIKVVQSTNSAFDQDAKAHVRRAMFRPGRNHGRPVRVLLALPIDFRIRR